MENQLQSGRKEYDGYPSLNQVAPAPSATTTVYTITTQSQLPRWPSVDFLQPMQGLKLVEKKPCCDTLCLKICCRRKLRIFNDGRQQIGHSVVPYRCCTTCSCEDVVDVLVPQDYLAMQTKTRCEICEYCCGCLYLCNDIKYMDIIDNRGASLGSFEYSPKCCRHEPSCCCKGTYVIKNRAGVKVMYIPNITCCVSCCDPCCSCDPCCRCCRCICYIPMICCRNIPCIYCSPEKCMCLLCNGWSEPVMVASTVDHSTVSHISRQYDSVCRERFCCRPMQYYVDFERDGEMTENKALLLGSAIIMDHYGLNEHLINDWKYAVPGDNINLRAFDEEA